MIAGPYSTGAKTEAEREANLLALNQAAYQVFRRGHVPIIGVNLALPVIRAAGPEMYDAIMMPLSLALADRCDAVLRIGGPSRGPDDEVERVRARGGHVYHSVEEIPRCFGDRLAGIEGFWTSGAEAFDQQPRATAEV